jgi:predicted Zn-dependent protease
VDSVESKQLFRKSVEAYRLGRLDQAADGFRALVDGGSNEPLHLSYSGLLELRCRDRARHGLELCRRALALAPDDGQVHLNLAKAYRHAGRIEQARGVLRRALRTWPNNSGLQREIERLDARRRPPIPVLDRDHMVNKYLGILRSKVSRPRT